MNVEIKPNRRFQQINSVTFRDGQQSGLFSEKPGARLELQEKIALLDLSIALGITWHEVFSPVVNTAERNDLYALRAYIDETYPDKNIVLAAHVRCHMDDITAASDGGANALHMYMSASEIMMQSGHGYSLDKMVHKVRDTVEEVRKYYPDLYLRHSVEHAFSTSKDNIIAVFDAISESVNTLGIPDTNGVATPELITTLLQFLQKRYPENAFQGHFHNDYGYAIFNATTAALLGMEIIDGSALGVGERSGLTTITGFLLDLYRRNHQFWAEYTFHHAYQLNVLMADILGIPVPPSEPVSLSNRTHRSGVHQVNTDAYEQKALQIFGVTEKRLLLSPLSGWHHIHYYLRQKLYLDVSEQEAREITRKFKDNLEGMNGTPLSTILKEIAEPYNFPSLPGEEAGQTLSENMEG